MSAGRESVKGVKKVRKHDCPDRRQRAISVKFWQLFAGLHIIESHTGIDERCVIGS
jgi:hypothetical protein